MRKKTPRPLSVRRDVPDTHSTASAVEGISPDVPRSRGLLDGLLLRGGLMELRSERLADALAESLFHEAAGLTTFAARKTFGLHVGLSGR